MHPNLLSDVEILEVGAPVAAGSSIDNNSDRIDVRDCEGILFIAPIEDSVLNGVATLTAEQNAADSDTGMAALAGAQAQATSLANDDLNGKLLIVDVYRPQARYVQAVRTSATANIAFGTVVAVKYGRRKKPVANHSTVAAAASVSSPAEA